MQDAVLKAKIGNPQKLKNEEPVTAEERLLSWEEGRSAPSLSQLKSLANAYRRPLVTFFLAQPPIQASSLMDYRTFSSARRESPEFSALKRRIYQLIVNCVQ